MSDEAKFKKGDRAIYDGIKVMVIDVEPNRPPRIYCIVADAEIGYCEESDLTPIENREDRDA